MEMRKFTIDEAENCLPEVEKLIKRACRIRSKISWLLESNDALLEANNDSGFHLFVSDSIEVNRRFHQLYYKLYSALSKLQNIGVVVRDLEEGVVDFPFDLNGREAFLCWQLGEDRIRFWHEGDCFDDRRPVVDVDEILQDG
ncbi:DUF2203 family protein [Candidatus Woesearchaeota archaeon]|nr:MAG: DUF2203 family protein [Candidatus Woesearchaeota archaeon]